MRQPIKATYNVGPGTNVRKFAERLRQIRDRLNVKKITLDRALKVGEAGSRCVLVIHVGELDGDTYDTALDEIAGEYFDLLKLPFAYELRVTGEATHTVTGTGS